MPSNFVEDNLEAILFHLNQIESNTKPEWGIMTAQKMVEHLSDSLLAGMGKVKMTCPYEGEKLQRSRDFLLSDHLMPREFKAHFVDDNAPLRHAEFELAVDEFIEYWCDFEEHCDAQPEAKYTHPVFGELNLSEWRWMHRKHITHHFEQFGVEIVEVQDVSDHSE